MLTRAKNKTGLYIHVPFCEKKCGYCSFYSLENKTGKINSWLDALKIEAQKYSHPSVNKLTSPLIMGDESENLTVPEKGRGTALAVEGLCRKNKISINTLYIGGGTPTILNISQWKKLFEIIKNNFDLENLIEATVEANPNSLSEEHLKFFRDNNFSRISLGVQSLNDDELKILGRIHNSYRALKAMELVKNFGFNLSCDLIFAIPEQNLTSWAKSLKGVLNFVNHVSTYQLTLDPDVPMAKKFNSEDFNEQGYKFYRYAQYYLPKKNFLQYEISNFAPEGNECIHNILYWTQENVIALGASAAGYINGVRYKNPDTLEKYFEAAKNNFSDEFFEYEILTPHEKNIELSILNLRTKWGIKKSELLPEIEKTLNSMPQDLFINTPEKISLSKRGMRLGNSIWCELIGL